MAYFDESSTGYDWGTERIYQIERNDPVEGGAEGVSNRQGRELTRRTRNLHVRLEKVQQQADEMKGGDLQPEYSSLLKLQNKLKAIEAAIHGNDGDALIETLEEALKFINDNKGSIESLVSTYVKKSSIADNLTTSDATYVLSARQGKVLKELIDTALAAAKTYADQKVASLVDSSPAALDTLKELADALGNDPNFSTTVLNRIAAKADKTEASQSAAGLMSAADKQKLDDLTGGELVIQCTIPGME